MDHRLVFFPDRRGMVENDHLGLELPYRLRVHGRVHKHHAFPEGPFAQGIFLDEQPQGQRAVLPAVHGFHGGPLVVYALDEHWSEPTRLVRPQPQLLVGPDGAAAHDPADANADACDSVHGLYVELRRLREWSEEPGEVQPGGYPLQEILQQWQAFACHAGDAENGGDLVGRQALRGGFQVVVPLDHQGGLLDSIRLHDFLQERHGLGVDVGGRHVDLRDDKHDRDPQGQCDPEVLPRHLLEASVCIHDDHRVVGAQADQAEDGRF
mmetsp:Transcript_56686/g.111650  ORF Transcript_56686/g.111650 Transcript_56686/m.111650 type:complete len:266 (-) Transcript_56686:3-800(-)